MHHRVHAAGHHYQIAIKMFRLACQRISCLIQRGDFNPCDMQASMGGNNAGAKACLDAQLCCLFYQGWRGVPACIDNHLYQTAGTMQGKGVMPGSIIIGH